MTTTLPKGCVDGSTMVVCEADKNIFDPDLNTANNRMATGQGWAYDAAGNVITDPEGRTFTYDAENKQVKVENSLEQGVATETRGFTPGYYLRHLRRLRNPPAPQAG